ncbi:hypothetical protein [Aureibacillus halotolerans]|uniref:Uncharacterized protein n=1 Tax=Aureibacillus halotolerans TaxID=1508390 RepID=A0A4R6U801_9BACI|nr:hypothetical protein [Aureibacillus halotolerans]TDQ42680.1 hypothetical protein EV213_101109 [Aureibacillus halotolerans]
MDKKQLEDHIIKQFRQDEQMMILVFAQWCVNHDLDAKQLYARAYPKQQDNPELVQALKNTVPKTEAGPISDETVLGVLSLFDNADLASVVTEEIALRS